MADACTHNWVGNGLWDGKTDNGQRTGGVMYKCSKCGERTTDNHLKEKGGKVDKNFNIMGSPIVKKE